MPDTEFTYKKPDEQAYLITVIEYLRLNKGEKEIASLLEGSKCRIETSTSFSYQRWDGYRTEVIFYLPIRKLSLITDDIKRKLVQVCDEVMPAEAGLDVMDVRFSPLILETGDKQTLIEDLESIAQALSEETIRQLLPNDVKEKGREMAEVYLYLYSVENSLRLFIEKVAKEKFGDKYFDKLALNVPLQRKLSERKQHDARNKWLPLRGDSEIFFLDFKDLGTIIQNNWDLFSPYFPNQNWILTKIDELGECRNLVAHNSYIGSHEKDVIRINYTSILKQLNITWKNQAEKQS